MQTGTFHGFEVAMHDPGIALMTFNQPERLNGMTHHMKRDLVEILTQAQMDDAVRVIVFTGSGRAFSAGDDITGRAVADGEAQALMPDIPPGHHNALGTYNGLRVLSQSLNVAVRNLDKLTVAALNGVAIQTGLSLALACDFRLASSTARLGSATLRFGLLPDEGGQFLLVQLLGVAKAMDFLMRQRIVSAAEALAMGLVHEVVPADALLDRAIDLARELATGPQVAMRMLKRSLYHAAEMTLAQYSFPLLLQQFLKPHNELQRIALGNGRSSAVSCVISSLPLPPRRSHPHGCARNASPGRLPNPLVLTECAVAGWVEVRPVDPTRGHHRHPNDSEGLARGRWVMI